MQPAQAKQFGLASLPRDGLKNRLANGAMLVNQRGASSYALGTAIAYTLDRWFAWTGASPSGQTVTPVFVLSGGVASALRLARASGSTATAYMNVGQVLETLPNIDLQGQAVTLSFKARGGANFSGTGLYVTVVTGTGTDQGAAAFAAGGWTGYAVAASNTQPLTTSLATYVLQATIPAGATQVGVSFGYTPSGTAGSADYVDITDVQMEVGSFVAAQVTFERRAMATEVQLCQRYYYAPTLPNQVNGYADQGSRTVFTYWPFPARMRVSPTTGATFASGINVASPTLYATADGGQFSISSGAAGFMQASVSNISYDAEMK